MRRWLFLLTIVIFSIFEVTILDFFKVFAVKPDLLLIAVIMASLSFELKWALFLSIFAGVLKDIFGLNVFGINTLLFPLWSFLIIKLSKNILIENNFIYAVLVFIIVIFHDIVTRVINLTLGNFIPLIIFLRLTLIESLYTALIFPLVSKLIKPVLNYKR